LARESVRERLTVAPLTEVIHRHHQQRFGPSKLADANDIRMLLLDAAGHHAVDADPDFLFDEWQLVVDAWDIQDSDTYRDLPRLGRKVRMAASRRDDLWRVFDQVRRELSRLDCRSYAQMCHELRTSGGLPYTHIVVDEAQDIAISELLLLGSTLGQERNGLFFAGDIGQRIFRAPFPWSNVGVEVRGRSRSLKVNYRTSHQIRRCGDELLPEALIEADGSEESRLGVTSVFDGPPPEIHVFPDRQSELVALSQWAQSLRSDGIEPDEIAVLVRSEELVEEFSDFDKFVLLPMHEAKGAEFRAVAVAALDHDKLPDEGRIYAARDEPQLDEVMATERHLLYVAATRARDQLWLSGVEPISEFLADILEAAARS
jgi:superfamily I DNA/RNA helicase